MVLYTILRNAEGYARCRTSTIPYDYWRMGKEEKSRIGDRQEYQHNQQAGKTGGACAGVKCVCVWGGRCLQALHSNCARVVGVQHTCQSP